MCLTCPRLPHPPRCAAQAARQRLLAPDGRMTDEERQRIQQIVSTMTLNGGGTTGNLAAEEVARAAAAAASA